jgi:uncharacterized phosphosugar-binding protein
MSKGMSRYHEAVVELLGRIEREEAKAIDKAADLLTTTIADDQLVYVIGTGGHSNIGAWEMSFRAGGLRCVSAILDPGTSLEFGGARSSVIERTPGYGVAVLKAYNITSGVLIIVNAYGINTMTIDVAEEARRRGVPTVGITSREFSESVSPDHPARHQSRRNLCDLVDVHIDCHMPKMDAVVEVEGLPAPVAPVSTITNCFCINLLVVRTVEKCLERGIEPPISISGNITATPEMEQYKARVAKKYEGRIRLA